MTPDRKSTGLAALAVALALLGLVAAGHAHGARRERGARLVEHSAIAGRLGVTDLCLFNEARYTRHPSQADGFTPFQEHPAALEHFPSGSLAAAPRWGER